MPAASRRHSMMGHLPEIVAHHLGPRGVFWRLACCPEVAQLGKRVAEAAVMFVDVQRRSVPQSTVASRGVDQGTESGRCHDRSR